MNTGTAQRPARRLLLALVTLVAWGLATAAYWAYQEHADGLREDRLGELRAISELKVDELQAWRAEHLAHALRNANGPFVRPAVWEWLADPGNEPLRTNLVTWLQLVQRLRGYQNVMLVTPDGRLALTADPMTKDLETSTRTLIARVMDTREPAFGELFDCPVCQLTHLDVAAPVLDAEHRPAAVMVLRLDPALRLYPALGKWPTPSLSGETLLVRREDEQVIHLNAPRHGGHAPLSLRLPLDLAQVSTVQAALGHEGPFTGVDYRGVPVLAYHQAVPGTTWVLSTERDETEIQADIRQHGVLLLLLTLMGVGLTGALAAFYYSHRHKDLYQALFQAERTRREALEEFHATLRSIGDAVIATDPTGAIRQMNPVAERLTGWSEAEALGRPLPEIFRIINEDTRAEVENPVVKVLRERKVVGLANHTLLVARDGTEHPIADSGAPIHNDRGDLIGVVLVFRDQSQERAAQNALRAASEHWQQTFDAMADPVGLVASDGTVVQVNRPFAAMAGRSAAELEGEPCSALLHGTDAPPAQCALHRARQTGQRQQHEACINGTTYLATVDPITGPDDQLLGFVHILRDLTERKRAESALRQQAQHLRDRNEELSRFNQVAVGRELRMIELKQEVNALCERCGEPARYDLTDLTDFPAPPSG